jgi:hypothetical protein
MLYENFPSIGGCRHRVHHGVCSFAVDIEHVEAYLIGVLLDESEEGWLH